MTHVFRSAIIALAVAASAGAVGSAAERDAGEKPPPVTAVAPKAAPPETKKPEARTDQDHDKPAAKDGDHDADGGKPIVIPAAALSSLGIAIGPIERRTCMASGRSVIWCFPIQETRTQNISSENRPNAIKKMRKNFSP